MDHYFKYDTSEIDWCEYNYQHTPLIAEIVNVLTNIPFLILPFILLPLSRQYASHIDRGINIIWSLFLVLGLASAYFHATLSLVGQLLDEWIIFWLFCLTYGMWLSKRHYWVFGGFIGKDRKKFKKLMLSVCIIIIPLSMIAPWTNSIAQMFVGVGTCALLLTETHQCKSQRAKRLGARCALAFFAAVLVWVPDRFFCDHMLSFNLPYLHGVWHILSAIASYTSIVLFQYFNVIEEHPHYTPVIQYWPADRFEVFGVPYVHFKTAPKVKNHF